MRPSIVKFVLVFSFVFLALGPQATPAYSQTLKITRKITMEALSQHVAARVAKMPGVASVVPSSPGKLDVTTTDKREFTLGLGNLLDSVNGDVGDAERPVAEMLAVIGKTFVQPSASTGLTPAQFAARLIPVIKSKAFAEDFDRLARRSNKTAPGLAARPIAGDIVFAIGLDEDNQTQIMQSGSGKPFGMSDEAMFAQAKKNLLEKVKRLQMQEIGPIRLMDFNANYNASLLVIDEVWSTVAPGRENDVVVAVPARDALAFGLVSTDAKVVESLRGIATMPNQAYPVSAMLFRRSGNGWVVFK